MPQDTQLDKRWRFLKLSENLNNSFEYSKKLFGDIGTLIILIVLHIVPVVNWMVVGYAAKVLKESPGTDSPPKLERYGDLFIEGAKVTIASLIYLLVPAILIGAGVGSFIAAGITSGGPDFMANLRMGELFLFGGMGLVLVIAGVFVAFVMLIVLGAGIANMVKTGSFEKAFALGETLGIIRTIGWGKYLAWIVLAAVIAVIVGAVTGAIPFVGWILHAIISPVVMVFFSRSLGLLCAEATK